MKSWIDFYDERAKNFNTPEEVGCHYIDNKVITQSFTEKESTRIFELLKPNKTRTVYDLGCGAGYSSNLLKPHFNHVIGIDGGKKTIKLAKKHFPEIEYIIDDLNKLDSVDDHTIEFALLYGVIYNMGSYKDVKGFFKLLDAKCKTNARVLICKIPNLSLHDEYQSYRQRKHHSRNYINQKSKPKELQWIWFSTQDMHKLAPQSFDVTNILPNTLCEMPISAWFDTLLIKRG